MIIWVRLQCGGKIHEIEGKLTSNKIERVEGRTREKIKGWGRINQGRVWIENFEKLSTPTFVAAHLPYTKNFGGCVYTQRTPSSFSRSLHLLFFFFTFLTFSHLDFPAGGGRKHSGPQDKFFRSFFFCFSTCCFPRQPLYFLPFLFDSPSTLLF